MERRSSRQHCRGRWSSHRRWNTCLLYTSGVAVVVSGASDFVEGGCAPPSKFQVGGCRENERSRSKPSCQARPMPKSQTGRGHRVWWKMQKNYGTKKRTVHQGLPFYFPGKCEISVVGRGAQGPRSPSLSTLSSKHARLVNFGKAKRVSSLSSPTSVHINRPLVVITATQIRNISGHTTSHRHHQSPGQ